LVTRKNLLAERTRLAISVGGVALAVVLMTFLLSLYRGWDNKVGRFAEGVEADIWIATEGTTDFFAAGSILPLDRAEPLSALPAVERWSPLMVRPMIATRGSTKIDVHLVGYDTELAMGGPLRIEEGKAEPGPGEIIVDEALCHRYGVDLGDSIRAAGRDWKVVGTSSGGDFVFSQTVFVTLDQAQEALGMNNLATFLLLKLKDPSQREQVAQDIESAQVGISATAGDEFAAATRERVMGDLVPILAVILILAFIVGLAVAALTIYTATVEGTRVRDPQGSGFQQRISIQGSVRAEPDHGPTGVPHRRGADRFGGPPYTRCRSPVRGAGAMAGRAGCRRFHPPDDLTRGLRSHAPPRGHRPCGSVQGVVACWMAG